MFYHIKLLLEGADVRIPIRLKQRKSLWINIFALGLYEGQS